MRYLKKFESFKTNENQDMMFMPVDPIKASAEVYGDIAKALGGKFTEAIQKAEEATDSLVDSLGNKANDVLKSIEKFFGVSADKLTYDMIVSKLENSNESLIDDYDNADPYNGHEETMDTPLKDVKGGAFQKVCALIQKICTINMLSIGTIGTFLTWILEKLNIGDVQNFALSFVYSIVAFVIIHIIRKIDTAIHNKFA